MAKRLLLVGTGKLLFCCHRLWAGSLRIGIHRKYNLIMFRTLDDLKKKEEKPDTNKKTVDSYAGGESSGIALKTPDNQDKLSKIIEKAKKYHLT